MSHRTSIRSMATVLERCWIIPICVVLTAGCAASENEEAEIDQKIVYGGPDLLWQNASTGQMSTWLLSGFTVTGTLELDWRCGASDGCSSQWKPVDAGYLSILWHNPTSGELSRWTFGDNGTVLGASSLDWQCSAASGCSSAWRPIGGVTVSHNPCGPLDCYTDGLLWHNAGSGELSVWDLSDSTVIGAHPLSWKCGASDGCSAAWRAMLTADFNNDLSTDVLWYNESTGQVSIWLVQGGTVTGTRELDWRCSVSSGCATAWKIVDAADVDHDGIVDLTWYNAGTGELSTWLLNSSGSVKGAASFDWRCGPDCAAVWKPIGYVGFSPKID